MVSVSNHSGFRESAGDADLLASRPSAVRRHYSLMVNGRLNTPLVGKESIFALHDKGERRSAGGPKPDALAPAAGA
jgi:hypothetical protein